MSTQTLSGSRAGIGSAAVQDETVARTVVVGGVGVVPTPALPVLATGGPMVTMIH
jgi:hypothetical protein